MDLVINISDTLKQIADEDDFKTFSHMMWQSILMEAIKNGIPLDGIMAEISHKIKLCSDKKMSYGMEVALAIIDKYTKGVEE